MTPARGPRTSRSEGKLLLIDSWTRTVTDRTMVELPSLLHEGDLLVVNDAATLPASLRARADGGAEMELRLARFERDDTYLAVLFGEGDWRIPTEERRAPPRLRPGDRIILSDALEARVEKLVDPGGRLAKIRFSLEATSLLIELYRIGKPIQYSYLREEQPLWSFQNSYAARPWAMEMPSAGRPLDWKVLMQLRRSGIEIAALTHAAGISSTGNAELDALLPLKERYVLPKTTIEAIQQARTSGNRVIAAGTSVTRALEGNAARGRGRLLAGEGETDLILSPDHRLQVVDGLLSGMHEPGESHYRLLGAFAPRELLERGLHIARNKGYLAHEFGDSCLIFSREARAGGRVNQWL